MNKVSIWLSAILCTIALTTPAKANVIAGAAIFDIDANSQELASGTANASSSFEFFDFDTNPPTFGGEANATASASLGILKAFASVNTAVPQFLHASASSSFQDTLNIVLMNDSNITSLPGTPGFADIRVAYNWSLFALNGSASGSIVLGVADGSAGAAEVNGNGGSINPLEVSGTAQAIDAELGEFFTVRIPFASGDDLPIVLSLLIDAFGDGPTGTFADALHSAYWGGILAVRDSDLNIVPFSVTSESGTDYRQSFVPGEVVPTVPEPATLSMLCCGIVFLLNRRVRRGRRLSVT